MNVGNIVKLQLLPNRRYIDEIRPFDGKIARINKIGTSFSKTAIFIKFIDPYTQRKYEMAYTQWGTGDDGWFFEEQELNKYVDMTLVDYVKQGAWS